MVVYVLGVGSRTWTDVEVVKATLAAITVAAAGHEVRVLSGGAGGADSLVAAAARDAGLKVKVMPADWNRHGRSAGFRRNEEMVTLIRDRVVAGHVGIVVAFDHDSRGTAHTMRIARHHGLSVVRVTE